MWKFEIKARSGDLIKAPFQDFFTNREGKTWCDSLIRELFQNSLDECLDDTKPVKIRLSLPTVDEEEIKSAQKYIKDMKDHIIAKNKKITDKKYGFVPEKRFEDWEKTPCALVVEDFNTKGLIGPYEYDDLKSNWFAFLHSAGVTNKPLKGTAGGAFGIGKYTCIAVSRIQSFFCLTQRHDDSKNRLLSGKALFQEHQFEKGIYTGYARYQPSEDGGDPDPFCDKNGHQSEIDDFIKIFKLKRKTEPGLSLIIPLYLDDEENGFSQKNIIKSVLKEHFYAILEKKLVVNVCDDAEINSNTIFDYLEILGQEEYEYRKIYEICQNIINKKFISVDLSEIDEPINRENLNKKKLQEIKKNFNEGKLISITKTAKVVKGKEDEEGKELKGKVNFYIQNTPEIKGKQFFIRNYFVIDNHINVCPGVIGFVADEKRNGIVTDFMKSSEGPHHDEFKRDFAETYYKNESRGGKSFFTEITNTINNLYFFINQTEEHEDLSHVFGKLFQVPEDDTKHPPPPPPPPPLVTHIYPTEFSTGEGNDCIVVKPSDSIHHWDIPFTLEMDFALKINGSLKNCFRKYKQEDFDFGNPDHGFTIEGDGWDKVKGPIYNQNNLKVEITDKNFEIIIKGKKLQNLISVPVGVVKNSLSISRKTGKIATTEEVKKNKNRLPEGAIAMEDTK